MGKLEMGKIINHNMGKLFINMGTAIHYSNISG